MNNRLPSALPERNPLTHEAHSHQVLWQITIPIVLGSLVVLALAVLAGISGPAEASLWADISLIFLIIPAMLISVVFLFLFAALIYGLYARQAQDIVYKVEQRVKSGSDLVAEPVIRTQAFLARIRVLGRKLGVR
jgi:heme/copper-type cytochrome/quinol oxidase subunit 2